MISVVIPCYNAAFTLAATIESALMQDVSKEVIVVNDGSTDGSAAVIESFGDRIWSFSTENRGVSSARASGTELARGENIQYLDSDDLLTAGTLAVRLAALEASGADVVHTDWQKFSVGPNGMEISDGVIQPDIAAIEADCEIATATSRFWAPPAALLYRRGIVERIGGWHAKLPVIQDARFMFDAASKGARFVHAPGIGARYRVSPQSLSRRNNAQFIADCALNASEIDALWRARGTLTAVQEIALAEMWSQVATASLVNGLENFGQAREGYNRVAQRRASFEAGWIVRSIAGATAAAGIMDLGLRVKGVLRKLASTGTRA